jgi:hypothetical protein
VPRRLALVLALTAAAACGVGAAVSASPSRAVDPAAPYRGLGAWVSLFGHEWSNPAAAVRALAARRVRTLYLEIGRSNTPAAIARPVATALFLDTAHRYGMKVVAWYYPTFRNVGLDIARTLTTARYHTPAGQRFDGVAADIEDPAVRSPTRRNARTIQYSQAISAAIRGYPWGAITYPPVALDLNPSAWPNFPWATIARDYVAFLPMAYWRTRTHTAAGAAWYAAGNLAALRVLTGRANLVVHMIGSGGTSTAEAFAFSAASISGGAAGISLYPAYLVSPASWSALALGQDTLPPLRPAPTLSATTATTTSLTVTTVTAPTQTATGTTATTTTAP